MNRRISKMLLSSAMIAVALTCRPLVARCQGTHVDWQSSSTTTAADPGSCDANTFLPKTGDASCVGTLAYAVTNTGSLQGQGTDEVAFVALVNGEYIFTDYFEFTGTVSGLGTGSFAVIDYNGVVQPDGSSTWLWRVVNGSGSGQLAGITGNGKSTSPSCTSNCFSISTGSMRLPKGH